MFPETFVAKYLAEFTSAWDFVLDPFSGRGTTLLQALLMDRQAVAMDINPVAYCISGAKAQVPSTVTLHEELDELQFRYRETATSSLDDERTELPTFFPAAFHSVTLNQLLFLRRTLNWRHNAVHRFIAALILGILHGEQGRSRRYLSNQMPRTISPKPNYAVRYWTERGLQPPDRNVFSRLHEEVDFRLSRGAPEHCGWVVLGDARKADVHLRVLAGRCRVIVTSPPYFNITNFEEDQWLRLWFLGYAPKVTYKQLSRDDRYENREWYWRFLREVWTGIVGLMQPAAYVVCRMGGKEMSADEVTSGLQNSLRSAFRSVELVRDPEITQLQRRQTNAFRPGSQGCEFEIDHVFQVER